MGKVAQTAVDIATSEVARLLLALLVTLGLIILLLRDGTAPDAYWVLVGSAFGFYFGGVLGTQRTLNR